MGLVIYYCEKSELPHFYNWAEGSVDSFARKGVRREEGEETESRRLDSKEY